MRGPYKAATYSTVKPRPSLGKNDTVTSNLHDNIIVDDAILIFYINQFWSVVLTTYTGHRSLGRD